ncbi:MAG: hypothetical protein JST54_30825 [Deltaproteobacteria bacterium]|nr:hypothetical protein [Deltaproteobacteria bacterium]
MRGLWLAMGVMLIPAVARAGASDFLELDDGQARVTFSAPHVDAPAARKDKHARRFAFQRQGVRYRVLDAALVEKAFTTLAPIAHMQEELSRLSQELSALADRVLELDRLRDEAKTPGARADAAGEREAVLRELQEDSSRQQALQIKVRARQADVREALEDLADEALARGSVARER